MNDRVSMFFFHLLLGHHSTLATVYVSLRNAHSILYVQHPHRCSKTVLQEVCTKQHLQLRTLLDNANNEDIPFGGG